MLLKISLSVFLSLAFVSHGHSQNNLALDLKSLYEKNEITAVNRSILLTNEGISVDAKESSGLVWLNSVEFTNGSIELDLRGKNIPQKSFVGVAFHGVDSNTYEVIYFRPFNFENQERKSRSLQYSAHPNFTWDVLREKFPGKYESATEPTPNPDDWFHAKIVVLNNVIKVYVNNNASPSLTVESIEKLKGKKIGFWVGNGSSGDFAKPIITTSK